MRIYCHLLSCCRVPRSDSQEISSKPNNTVCSNFAHYIVLATDQQIRRPCQCTKGKASLQGLTSGGKRWSILNMPLLCVFTDIEGIKASARAVYGYRRLCVLVIPSRAQADAGLGQYNGYSPYANAPPLRQQVVLRTLSASE